MNKIKEFSRSFIFLSVLYVAVGLILLLLPAMSVTVIGNGFGVIMIVMGITYGILFFTGSKKTEGLLQMDLIIGIICLAFGIFILLTPGFVEMVLPLAVSVLLLIGAIVKIQNAISMRQLMIRHWYLVLICAIVIIVLAILLLFNPFQLQDRQKIIYIGICLILDGLTNLLSLICIRVRSRKIKRMQEKNPGTDVKAMYQSEWDKADAAKAEKKAEKKAKKKQEDIIVDAKVTDVEPEETAGPAEILELEDAAGSGSGQPESEIVEPEETVEPEELKEAEPKEAGAEKPDPSEPES